MLESLDSSPMPVFNIKFLLVISVLIWRGWSHELRIHDHGDAYIFFKVLFYRYWEWGVKTIFIFRSKMTFKQQKDIEI